MGALIISGYRKTAEPNIINSKTNNISVLPIRTIHEGGLESISLTSSDRISISLLFLDIQLIFNKFIVNITICHKVFMCTLFYQNAFVQYDNVIGIFNGAKSVRNNNYSLTFEKLVKVLHDLSFVFGVKSIRGLVEYDEFRIFINSSCYE